jgi:hypothetical protein
MVSGGRLLDGGVAAREDAQVGVADLLAADMLKCA